MNHIKIGKWIFLLSCLLLLGCQKNDAQSKSNTASVISNQYQGYNFDNPTQKLSLSPQLKEISGLAYDATGDQLYTHNDETGQIFHVNKNTGKISSVTTIGKKGDYEGIAIKGAQVLLINSSGTILTHDTVANVNARIKTDIGNGHDIEGLAIHPDGKKLLLACKGKPLEKKKKYKAIYTYDPEVNKIDSTPFIKIKIKDLEKFVKTKFSDPTQAEKMAKKIKDFAPSAVAIHPQSGDVYIPTAHSSMLVIYDQKNNLKEIIHLDEQKMPQPEGICFDNNNMLYISTEGTDFTPGRIFTFSQQ